MCVHVTSADAGIEAWLGASQFAQSDGFNDACITRQEYLEKGSTVVKHHPFSSVLRK